MNDAGDHVVREPDAPGAPAHAAASAQDLEHLRLLGIAHYVLAGFVALFSLFPVIHLVVGLGVVTGTLPMEEAGADDQAFATLIGWMFVLMSALFIVMGLAMAAGVLVAGRFLQQQRHYVFCLVVACLLCMFMPFGTVVGVLTIVVLVREQVKRAFGVEF